MNITLFTNATESLQRMESVLEAKLKQWIIGFSYDKLSNTPANKGAKFFTLQINYTKHDGTTGTFSTEGESLPDLFEKIANKIATV